MLASRPDVYLPWELLMTRFILTCLALSVVSSGLFAADPPKTIKVGENPESVCRGFGGKLYVTMINGEEPGDGTIVTLDGDKVTVFAKGLNAPKGIAYVGDYLVVCDETTLWKVDKDGKTAKLVEGKNFPQPIEFLNDIAAGPDGASVYISEMSNPGAMFDPAGERKLWDLDGDKAKELPKKGCIYKVTLKGEISVAIPAGNVALRFPNGVAVGPKEEGSRVYAGDFFAGHIVTYEGGKYEILATGMRGIDGLTVTKDAFYASSWTQGKVWKVDRKTREVKVILEGLKSAADFFYDAEHKQLIVPDMLGGTLTFLPIE